jgi:hypothetical protein
MRQTAEIADDARQRGRDDVLVQCGKHKRQHQSGKHKPELLSVGIRPNFRSLTGKA